jgi:hypothetical protein
LGVGLIKLYLDPFFIIPNITVKLSVLCETSDRGGRITITWFFGSWIARKGSRSNWMRLMLNDRLYYVYIHLYKVLLNLQVLL